jgi:hypothetical protein
VTNLQVSVDLTLKQLGEHRRPGCLSVSTSDGGGIRVQSEGSLPRTSLRRASQVSKQVSRFVNVSGQSVSWLHEGNRLVDFRRTSAGRTTRSVRWFRLLGFYLFN